MNEMSKITSASLITAARVVGTNVFNSEGQKLGIIDDIMIDRASGRTVYAVMAFGGFLGMGESHHPLPWGMLHYDPTKGGYIVALSKEQLREAPYYAKDAQFDWTPEYGRRVDSYYRMPTYWE
jgi:hypothetical protein